MKAPPMGIYPWKLFVEDRIIALESARSRYENAGYLVPRHIIDEIMYREIELAQITTFGLGKIKHEEILPHDG
jgi:hypothetical protein